MGAEKSGTWCEGILQIKIGKGGRKKTGRTRKERRIWVRVKCVRCPWVLQTELSVHYSWHFILSLSLDYFSPRRGCPRVLKFCMGFLRFEVKHFLRPPSLVNFFKVFFLSNWFTLPPIDTSGNFPAAAHVSAESPSNISPNPSEVISEVSEGREVSRCFLGLES